MGRYFRRVHGYDGWALLPFMHLHHMVEVPFNADVEGRVLGGVDVLRLVPPDS